MLKRRVDFFGPRSVAWRCGVEFHRFLCSFMTESGPPSNLRPLLFMFLIVLFLPLGSRPRLTWAKFWLWFSLLTPRLLLLISTVVLSHPWMCLLLTFNPLFSSSFQLGLTDPKQKQGVFSVLAQLRSLCSVCSDCPGQPCGPDVRVSDGTVGTSICVLSPGPSGTIDFINLLLLRDISHLSLQEAGLWTQTLLDPISRIH